MGLLCVTDILVVTSFVLYLDIWCSNQVLLGVDEVHFVQSSIDTDGPHVMSRFTTVSIDYKLPIVKLPPESDRIGRAGGPV